MHLFDGLVTMLLDMFLCFWTNPVGVLMVAEDTSVYLGSWGLQLVTFAFGERYKCTYFLMHVWRIARWAYCMSWVASRRWLILYQNKRKILHHCRQQGSRCCLIWSRQVLPAYTRYVVIALCLSEIVHRNNTSHVFWILKIGLILMYI